MPRWAPDDNLDNDSDDDDVPWDADEPALVECPYCHAEMLEDAPQCPECGGYPSQEDTTPKKPSWVFLTAVVLLATFLLFVFLGI